MLRGRCRPLSRAVGALTSTACNRIRVPPSRRRVLFTGLAAAGTALGGRIPRARHVAVLGAGLAGLSAAFILSEAGVEVEVFEARRRPGGRVLSRKADPGAFPPVDLGGTFVNSDHEAIRQLTGRLGVRLEPRVPSGPSPTEAYRLDGIWLTEADLADRLAPLARSIATDADLLASTWDRHGPRIDAMTVARYLDEAGLRSGTPERRLVESFFRAESAAEMYASGVLGSVRCV